MYDHDVFAVLIPYDTRNKANSAFKLAHNVKWFQPAVGGVAQSATIESREPTPARDSQLEEEEKESGGAVDRLVLTFSKLMQLEGLRDGVQAGTSTATSHILLGHRGTRGVSARHYRIAVDDEMRIWLHDHSMHGTAVGYGGQNMDQVRVGETWLLADAPGTANIFSPTTIDSGGLIVAIDFPNHQGRDAQYLENLCALIEKSKENEVPGVQGLGLDSQPTTEPPSEAQTVSDRLIYFKHREIGSGAFGRVFKIIRARDGKVLAGKVVTPPPTNSQKRRRGEVDPAWLLDIRREYTIMKDNPHPNIVQVFGMREWPEIMIVMPYFPSGNIAQAGKNVSPGQWRTWAETWVDMLIMQLDDQEEGTDIDLLQGMFAINQERRLTARKGLMKGLKDGLFTRRAVDGLVACAVGGQEEEEEKAANVAGGVEPPTATQRADAEDDPDATILLSRLGGGVPDSSGELV
ncbi:hypothetical protein GGTG_13689 [Gaeumannomyces tritici R3-111a-1]|uniref:Protein kinase domain-containing protein n=1 Tax=Gaeumannomyces tritici (strain R3-111a-1) TaxID=644352 RepID=J3PJK3_GAET3|nr:hypothetical protein GGTG_13689 [Gaeumannomyces tritici R3-111a-1]EJT68737.1 hypothetical protein GGTG_13689 [Gaeumannomyces tritici R3-111a-1]